MTSTKVRLPRVLILVALFAGVAALCAQAAAPAHWTTPYNVTWTTPIKNSSNPCRSVDTTSG